MEPVIIACETVARELAQAMEQMDLTWPVIWLPGGRHNVPETRRDQIQAVLDSISHCDTVLLAMSLCGGSVTGLRTGDFRLVVPRCDDCITLLLGDELRQRNPATYFLTEGWLQGTQSIWAEYGHCVEKYGENRTGRIFSAMLAHYRYLALVDAGGTPAKTEAQIREIARVLGLEYRRLEGSLGWLLALLTPPWSGDRFLVVPPYSNTTQAMCRQKGAAHDP